MDIAGAFSGWGGTIAVIGRYIVYFLLMVVFCGIVTTGIIMLLVLKQRKKVIEINLANRRIQIYDGRLKKTGDGLKKFWASKIKRFLPNFQEDSIYMQKDKDVLFLIKDNNGLMHTAKVPSYDEIKKWYKVVHDIDLDNTNQQTLDNKALRDIYLQPSPHEDLEWLSGQCVEANKEFSVTQWWQSPVIAYIGVGFVCFLMIAITLIFKNKGL
jgi:L-rhamnose mutarotase